MQLDIATLMAAGSFVAGLGGLLLLVAWTQIRAATALLWWSAGHFALSISIAMIAFGLGSVAPVPLAFGGLISTLSVTFIWVGALVFVRRPVPIVGAALGLLTCVAAGALAPTLGFRDGPMLATFLAWTCYLSASVHTLWQGRAEPLKARGPLIGVMSLHAVIFAGGVFQVLFQGGIDGLHAPLNSWFGLIHIEALVYVLGTATFMPILCRERSELGYQRAALSDALTGIANRGAFFAGAERLLVRSRGNNVPLSIIVFDLDHFKLINDTHGHAVGDRVIGIFADTARGILRPSDFFGRHGGEEFAVVLPGATVETAFAIADRIRRAFGEAAREIDEIPLYATVSAGVAAANLSADFAAALDDADRALYRAKNRGRNRVEHASNPRPDGDDHRVIRVA